MRRHRGRTFDRSAASLALVLLAAVPLLDLLLAAFCRSIRSFRGIWIHACIDWNLLAVAFNPDANGLLSGLCNYERV